jgi:hypothetical protein
MTRATITIALLALISVSAYAATYLWNPNKRPPITLPEALRRAEALLGEDAKQRYCIGMWLYGNKAQDGKECGWHLVYAAEDGSKKLVFIDENGNGNVEQMNGPIDWRKKEGRRTGLEDIGKRLNAVLEASDYEERAEVAANQLVLHLRTRTYRIHPKTESGEFGENLVEVIGPKSDGIVIKASVVTKPDRVAPAYGYEEGVYWYVQRRNFLLTTQGKFVKMEMLRGRDVSDGLFLAVWQAFGEPEPGMF